MDFTDFIFLRLKNPNNQATKETMCRVLYFLRDIIGFSEIPFMWYEQGDQNQQHIHCVIKKKMPNEAALRKMSKTFKTKKLKYFGWGIPSPNDDISCPGYMLEHEVKLDNFNWHVSEFSSKQHLYQTIYEYRFKTISPEFVD